MDSSAQFGSRALFPTLDCRIYANHASVGPLPLPAIDAMNAVIAGQAQHGIAAIKAFHEDLGVTRAVAGSLLGVSAANIALVSNTSTAISCVAASIPWQTGDAIVKLTSSFWFFGRAMCSTTRELGRVYCSQLPTHARK